MGENKNQPFSRVALLLIGIFGIFAAIFAGIIALTSSASFLVVFWWIMVVVVVIMVSTFVWVYLIEPSLVKGTHPHIYVMEDEATFLYSKGNQRMVFNFVTLLKSKDNDGSVAGINHLYISKYRALNESRSYLVFDRGGELAAILPYRERYSNDSADIVLVWPGGNKEQMSVGKFIDSQAQILRDAVTS